MEMRFQNDFSAVRVHADRSSSDATRALGAVAFSVGPHLVFGAEQYRPHSETGRRLLAHELAHVLQNSSYDKQLPLRLGGPGDQAEREAESVAEGRSATGLRPSGADVLRRAVTVVRQTDDRVTIAARQQIAAARQVLTDPRLDASARARLEYEITAAESALARYRASHLPGLLGQPGAVATTTANPASAVLAVGMMALIALGSLLASRRDTGGEAAAALAAALGRLMEVTRPYAQEPVPRTPTAPQPGPSGPGPTPDLGPLVTAAAAARALELATRSGEAEQTSNDCAGMKQSGLVSHECWELDNYPYEGRDLESARQRALRQLQDLNPDARLDPYKEAVTTEGPCPGKGSHTNVRDLNRTVVRDPSSPGSDYYFGSIVCCPCCLDEPTGPVLEARCGLV
jgi:hypothetical protein